MTTQNDQALENFASAISSLVRKIRANQPEELRAFSLTQKSVLIRLEMEGPTTSAALARAEAITAQSMGVAISQLEKAGLVERKDHPTDNKRILITISRKGNSLLRLARKSKHDWLQHSFSQFSKEEKSLLLKAAELIALMVAE